MFFIWFSVNFNILAFSTGSSGPVFFSLGIKDSLLVIFVVDVMCVIQKILQRSNWLRSDTVIRILSFALSKLPLAYHLSS